MSITMADEAILTLLKVTAGGPIKVTNAGIMRANMKVETWEESVVLFFVDSTRVSESLRSVRCCCRGSCPRCHCPSPRWRMSSLGGKHVSGKSLKRKPWCGRRRKSKEMEEKENVT
jgi:hypothetical protein